MQGAYLLWDDLLQNLCSRQPLFLGCLLEALLAALTRHTLGQEARTDSGKEALHLWLLHITYSDVWLRSRQKTALDVPAWLVKQCCLHPGYWSQRLGEQIIEQGDDDFAETWSDLLAASSVTVATDEMEIDAVRGSSIPVSRDEAIVDDHDDGYGWRFEVMPRSLPIGVVR